jgi:hypothetical protein
VACFHVISEWDSKAASFVTIRFADFEYLQGYECNDLVGLFRDIVSFFFIITRFFYAQYVICVP